MYVLVTQNI